MYLKITNPGICYPEAFTVLGVSTARGSDGKIGMFGSGAKMGINTCLRMGINPTIVSGDMMVTFDCVTKTMGEKKFDQVVAVINGERKELGFATDFGAIDWNKIDYAIREFVSNAYDQGGCSLAVVDNIEAAADNSTSVYVEYTKDVKAYHQNIGKYFLDRELAANSCIINNESDELLVYRKGVLVSSLPNKSLFSYNINDIRVDESRNVDSWMVKYKCGQALRSCDSSQADKLVRAIVEDRDVAEVKSLDYDEYPRAKLKEAFLRVYPLFKICTIETHKYCKNKNSVIVVGNKAYKLLADCDVPLAEIDGGRTGAVNGYIPIETSTDCKRIFNRIWNKLVKLGYHNGKDKPKLAMFSKPMEFGCTTGGYYENGTVYISRNHVNAKVILEEIGHYVTDADDCTRDFQDWAFSVGGALL